MPRFEVYAPLSKLSWNGTELSVDPDVEIIRRPQPYPLRGLEDQLTSFDRNELFYADHWLKIDWSLGDVPSAAELVNLFLLALWLAEPTKTHVKFRFCVATNPEAPPGSMVRILDQFQWIRGATADQVTDADLSRAASFFPLLRGIRRRGYRLANALYLTYAGCKAGQWQVSLVCYAAAAEALLTYRAGSGITRRLALAYASLVGSENAVREQLFRQFCGLYRKRSDVIHGRSHDVAPGDRLPILAEFGDALRDIWAAVLDSANHREVLEESDEQRENFFRELQGDFMPSH